LDGTSRPDWVIPASELPVPTPAPTPVATPSPSASSSAPAQGPAPTSRARVEAAGPRPGPSLGGLAARSAATGTVLCLGLDPDPATLPDGFSRDLAGVERFATLVVEAAAPHARAINAN